MNEALLALHLSGFVGAALHRRLVQRFGSAENAVRAPRRDLEQVPGIGPVTSKAIAETARSGAAAEEIARAEKAGVRLVAAGEPGYPRPLQSVFDPPLVLSIRGTIDDSPALAVVGSRECTPYGLRQAGRFAQEFAGLGIAVVSGLARGVDTAAHKGALRKGRTVAVLGSGLLRVYPPENRKLADEIAEKGAVASEFGLTVGPEPTNFPRRNRIISGLSLGVLVIEASEKSGALITADWAMEQSREVFCLPGSVESPMSRGCHGLIQQGAKLVEAPFDVLEEIPAIARLVEPRVRLSPIERAVAGRLTAKAADAEAIAAALRLPAGTVEAALTNLVAKGAAKEVDGGYLRGIQ
ncbi:MAG: DNA-protecting protein DprA [Planctomycetes bacterium]|nr:DNA-protecting protein DprA [Planctomycetota bacterium]